MFAWEWGLFDFKWNSTMSELQPKVFPDGFALDTFKMQLGQLLTHELSHGLSVMGAGNVLGKHGSLLVCRNAL